MFTVTIPVRWSDGFAAGQDPKGSNVASVYLATQLGDVIGLLRERQSVLDQISQLDHALEDKSLSEKKKSKLEKKKSKLQAKTQKIEDKIEKARSKKRTQAICAFVTFHSAAASNEWIEQYESKRWRVCGSSIPLKGFQLFGLTMPLFMLKWFQDPSLMMQVDGGAAPKQKALRVLEAPEPTNILWENLEYTRFQRFCRRSLSFSFTILIIIISFAVIVWGKSFNESLNNTSKQCANATFTETCDLV